MTECFNRNGNYYSYYNDEKENCKMNRNEVDNVVRNDNPQDLSYLNEKATEYIRDCMYEKSRIYKRYPIAGRLLKSEIEKTQSNGRIHTKEPKYGDIYREKPIRVTEKVLLPVYKYPNFNFIGKLLGHKGNSLRRLQNKTLCQMTVLGRYSMKDRSKEEELRNSGDPKYSHLNDDLHIEILTIAPPTEATARIVYAMDELRKYIDIIRQEQLTELMDDPNPETLLETQEGKNISNNTNYKARNQASGQRQSYGSCRSAETSNSKPPGHALTQDPRPSRTQKVLSVLDRVSSAIKDINSRYPYEQPMTYKQPIYDSDGLTISISPYEVSEYESELRLSPSKQEIDYYQIIDETGSSGSRSSNSESSGSTPDYHISSSSRIDDNSATISKHSNRGREVRYKSAPYTRRK